MELKEKTDIQNIIHILMQLDEKSLLLIDSGAKLLVARQNMNVSPEASDRSACHQIEMKEFVNGQ